MVPVTCDVGFTLESGHFFIAVSISAFVQILLQKSAQLVCSGGAGSGKRKRSLNQINAQVNTKARRHRRSCSRSDPQTKYNKYGGVDTRWPGCGASRIPA
jgi:hypothetical protein